MVLQVDQFFSYYFYWPVGSILNSMVKKFDPVASFDPQEIRLKSLKYDRGSTPNRPSAYIKLIKENHLFPFNKYTMLDARRIARTN